jgi:hypothetical protein
MNGSEHLPEHATADAGSALDVAGIAAVLAEHSYTYPDSFCACTAYVGAAPERDWPRHAAKAVAAHVEALREADRA